MAARNLPLLQRLAQALRAPEPLSPEDSEALVALVERNDVAGLRFLAGAGGQALWTALHSCQRNPAYPNRGTLLHWAVWHRRWAVAALAVSLGAELAGARGQGCWMEGRTAQEYAAHLDARAGHPYYRHAESLAEAAGDSEVAAERGCVLALPAAGALEDASVRALLCDMVERHCLPGLEAALGRWGAPALGRALLGPADNPYNNQGTLAHWAVWQQDWELLRWLAVRGCAPLDVAGAGGGWLCERTLEQYASQLDELCAHPFYRHRVHLAEALSAAAAPPPAAAAQPTGATPAAALPAGGETRLNHCCVCLEAPSDSIFRPCNHLCVCAACARGFAAGAPCPICRVPSAGGVERVFMA